MGPRRVSEFLQGQGPRAFRGLWTEDLTCFVFPGSTPQSSFRAASLRSVWLKNSRIQRHVETSSLKQLFRALRHVVGGGSAQRRPGEELLNFAGVCPRTPFLAFDFSEVLVLKRPSVPLGDRTALLDFSLHFRLQRLRRSFRIE